MPYQHFNYLTDVEILDILLHKEQHDPAALEAARKQMKIRQINYPVNKAHPPGFYKSGNRFSLIMGKLKKIFSGS